MAKKKQKRPKRAKRYQGGGRSGMPQLDALGVDVPIQDSIDVVFSGGQILVEEEDDSIQRALEMHPNLLELSLSKGLPDEAIDETGNVWNVSMHLNMHATVENQLAQNSPEGIADVALKMEADGILGTHEVRHVIMNSLANSIWKMQRDKVTFDDQAYMADIDESYRIFCDAKK